MNAHVYNTYMQNINCFGSRSTTDDRVELEEDARKGMDKPVKVNEKLIYAQYSNASEQAGRKSISTARKLYNKSG